MKIVEPVFHFTNQNVMAWLIGIIGVLLIITVLWDVFETIVLPRRVTRRVRLTRLFYRLTWAPWWRMARTIRKKRRQEMLLGIYGPLSLLALLTVWAVMVVVGFAVIHFALGSGIGHITEHSGFFTDLYYSGTTFFTLGLGDIAQTKGEKCSAAVIQVGEETGVLGDVAEA